MGCIDPEGKHVYGGTFVALMRYIRERKGKGGMDALFRKMAQNGYRGPASIEGFKLKGKYPLRDYLIFMETVEEMYGPEVVNEMSRAAPKKKGIVGWFVRWAGTPGMLFRKAGEYWPQFYDFGRIEGELVEDGKAVIRGYSVCASPILCRAHAHYFVGAVESIGLKNVRCEHTKCECRGDEFGEWVVVWG